MDNLSIKQLELIPWNKKYISGPEVPPEPDPEEIPILIKLPFMKRDSKYLLFYTWLEIIRMVGSSEKKMKILDAACGRGQICQVLYFYGHDVTGADVMSYFGADKNIKFIQCDLNETFPFETNTFDIVINSTALHYLNSTEHFFSEAKRILKTGGRIIFSIPNISNLSGRYYFFKTGRISEYSSAILARKNFLYPDYVFELLTSKGFGIRSIKGVAPLINYKIRLFNLILGKWMFGNAGNELKYSPVLIIEAVKQK